MSSNIRKRREKLFIEQNQMCHWCGIKTLLPKRGKKSEQPDNMATVDHLRTKLEKNRKEPNPTNKPRTVLSCRKCNLERGLVLEKIFMQSVSVNIKSCRFYIHEI